MSMITRYLPIVALATMLATPFHVWAAEAVTDAELAAVKGSEMGLWPIEGEVVLSTEFGKLCGRGPGIPCSVNGEGSYRCCGRFDCGGVNADGIMYGSHVLTVSIRDSCGSDIGGHPLNYCQTTKQARSDAGRKECFEDFNCSQIYWVRTVLVSGICVGCG